MDDDSSWIKKLSYVHCVLVGQILYSYSWGGFGRCFRECNDYFRQLRPYAMKVEGDGGGTRSSAFNVGEKLWAAHLRMR